MLIEEVGCHRRERVDLQLPRRGLLALLVDLGIDPLLDQL